MLETILSSVAKAVSTATIAGWDGVTMYKSSGVSGDMNSSLVFSDPGSSAPAAYVKIPYQGTPDLSGSPTKKTRITAKLKITNFIGAASLVVWSRYQQHNDINSYMIGVAANGTIQFIYNNSIADTAGKITLGVEHEIKTERINNEIKVYLDGVLIFTRATGGALVGPAAWDWVFGNYLATATQPVNSTNHATKANWTLYKFEAIEF